MAQRPAHKPLTSPFAAEPHLAPLETVKKTVKKDPSVPPAAPNIKKKAAVWAEEEVIERIRAAWFHTPTTSADREVSFSEFLLQAALVRAKAREKKFNGGSEFPRVPAGKIGVGRKS
ncbi:MAG: hypothetical protein ACXVYB_00050 [Arthrobacter sp.]